MKKKRPGAAIRPSRRTKRCIKSLRGFAKGANKRGDLKQWRRVRAVILYIEGKRVIAIADYFGVTRGSVNRWLQWYDKCGLDGLRSVKRLGRAPRLSVEQRAELVTLIEAGPSEYGFDAGIWTGPMIGELIRRSYGVRYHFHHIPKLLHSLGFSVQRPRKRLARADHDKQEIWLRKRLPAIKKKARACRGVVLFEDEASFWLDGTLHRTWARVGQQPRVDTYGQRKTAHVFGAVNLETAAFHYRFTEVFNGGSFFGFLKQLVAAYNGHKIFLIIDNAPAHWLPEEGQEWLHENRDAIELHRLPPYSPEFMPVEGIWKATRKLATHNKFYATVEERNSTLRRTFSKFQRHPDLLAPQVARFR